MVCPFCGSGDIIRKGYDRGRQRFYCKECRRFFIEKVKHRRNYPKEYKIRVVKTALRVGFSEKNFRTSQSYDIQMDERTLRRN